MKMKIWMNIVDENVHGLRIPRDSARELIYLWAKNNLVEIIHEPTTEFIWTGTGIGDILLYDWDKSDTLEKAVATRGITANIILWGNPTAPKSPGNSPWILWGRHPELIAKYDHDLLDWDQKDITSAFVGRIENGIQHRNRTQHDWSSCIELFDMPIGADAKYRYGPEEYLTVMRRVKYGLSLPGYGNKCNRDIELFATGVVPIFTPGCATDYYDPLIIGKHVLYAETPAEVTRIIRETTPEKWRELRDAGRDWYLRNCSMHGSFEITKHIINGEITKLKDNVDVFLDSIRRIPTKKTSDICRIGVDLMFFQRPYSGISRVWETILTHIPRVLDREKIRRQFEIIIIRRETCNINESVISQYRQITIPNYDYMQSHEKQTAFLSQICNELDINIFMTTYYTHINRLIATKTQQLLLIHDMIPENLGYTMNPMWQQKHRAIRSATRIICISQSTSADVKRYFADVPAARENTVIYNAFDRNIWQWTPLSSTSKSAAAAGTTTTETIAKVLIMSSNTDNYKGLSIIIDMIRKFSARFPAKSWEFHFICSKPPGYVNPPHVNVIFHGSNNSLTNIEIAEIYRNATVILYPTGAEGFGLPILEAAYLQIPIITRALPVFLELFDGYPDMIADTPEAFYRKLMELSRTKFRLNDEKQRIGRELLTKYNPITQSTGFVSIFREMHA